MTTVEGAEEEEIRMTGEMNITVADTTGTTGIIVHYTYHSSRLHKQY